MIDNSCIREHKQFRKTYKNLKKQPAMEEPDQSEPNFLEYHPNPYRLVKWLKIIEIVTSNFRYKLQHIFYSFVCLLIKKVILLTHHLIISQIMWNSTKKAPKNQLRGLYSKWDLI